MAKFNRYSSQAPSAPPLSAAAERPYHRSYSHPHLPPYSRSYSSSYSSWDSAGYCFPPGTHPEVIRSFQAADHDRSGSINEWELQAALSSGHERFSIRTIRMLMFFYKNPVDPSKLGPAEFAALWNCLGQWRAIFDGFDRDQSGKMDSEELKEALQSLGYAVPPSVLQFLISNYNDGGYGRGGLNFDNFVECGVIVKGLTDKFKEKDPCVSGSVTFTYDVFMLMTIPFIVP
ncbi:probable calcium-binding protein CML48 isoform X1 [Typha latifolia]|uniref:probable calcium-binding protein CML48 isoform X1 n=1 Tax=Typha latifolia TaxID=4733 RepID=UPI003C2F2A08